MRIFAVSVAALGLLVGCASNETASDEPSASGEAITDMGRSEVSSEVTEVPSQPQMQLVFGGIGVPSAYVVPNILGEACVASGEFYEIKEGAQVKVLGPSDEVVGLTRLNAAQYDEPSGQCFWLFTTDVPKGLGFYSVTVLDWSSEIVTEGDLLDVVIAPKPSKPLIDLSDGL